MDAKTFWGNVKPLIKKHGLTRAVFASVCNIPFGTLQGWIAKDVLPDVVNGVKIAKVLNTTAEYLVSGGNPERPQDIAQIAEQLAEFTEEERKVIITMVKAQIDYLNMLKNKDSEKK